MAAEKQQGRNETEALNALFAAACRAQEQGDTALAKNNYLFLLEKFPDAPILHYNLGLVFFAEDDFAAAVASFSRAASLRGDDTDILFNLALARKKAGDIAGAVCGFQQLLEKEPWQVDVLFSLGGCYQQSGELDKAIYWYQQVLAIEADHLAAHNTLAYLYHKRGEKKRAVSHYQAVVERDPHHQGANYMLAALQGDSNILASPMDYVRTVFDNYAESFEQSLIDKLEYRVPQQLRKLCGSILPPRFSASRLLDLGCGTGLSGAVFADMAERIDGVDISQKMLAIAREKELYTQLAGEDIIRFLTDSREKYSFFLACDVFNYFGDLAAVFTAITASALPDSYLCFSTEAQQKEGFALRETGRFTHNPDYIRSFFDNKRYTLMAEREAVLRRERDIRVTGTLWLVRLSL